MPTSTDNGNYPVGIGAEQKRTSEDKLVPDNGIADSVSGPTKTSKEPRLSILQRLGLQFQGEQGRRTLFFMTIVSGIAAIALKVATIILHYCYGNDDGAYFDYSLNFLNSSPTSAAWYALTGVDIAIVLVTVVYCGAYHWHDTRQPKDEESAKDSAKGKNKGGKQAAPAEAAPLTLRRKLVIIVLTLLNVLELVTTIALLVHASLRVIQSDAYEIAIAVEIVESLSATFSGIFTIIVIIYLCWSLFMVWQSVLTVISLLHFVIAVVTVLINDVSRSNGHGFEATDDQMAIVRRGRIYPMFALIEAAVAFIGIGISLSISVRNRLSSTLGDIIRYYVLLSTISGILSITWLCMAIVNTRLDNDDYLLSEMLLANPILAGAAIALHIIGNFSALRLQKRPSSGLRVEKYSFAGLRPDQVTAWAKLIDTYHRTQQPGAASGAEALDLMLAYQNSPMADMTCQILRIYDPKVGDTERGKYYEKVRAWQELDNSAVFNDVVDVDEETLVASTTATQEGAGLSKNAAKKAAMKAAKKAAKKSAKGKHDSVTFPIEGHKTAEELQADLNFRAELLSTEAFVMITYIHEYDLTAALTGKFGKILNKLLGSGSAWKLLCIRMGLLATHWPFRQAVFFTSPTRRPNARSAACLQALSHWNDSQPSAQRCSMILDPLEAHAGREGSIKPSGWLNTPLPPSHVIDLRKYKGKTLQDYLKAIKYRNQAVAFNKAKGEVIETTDFTRENCEIAMDLWHKIAEKRTSDGYTAVLAEPTVDFLMSLGSKENNPYGFRKLLFLKVEDKVIASCVLFFLGATITSDIQGLDHDLARVYKAYFVMMQETIQIALRENISFVDFGPTTSKPKMDIGCSEVPLAGALYARQPLSTMVRLFASQVTSG